MYASRFAPKESDSKPSNITDRMKQNILKGNQASSGTMDKELGLTGPIARDGPQTHQRRTWAVDKPASSMQTSKLGSTPLSPSRLALL